MKATAQPNLRKRLLIGWAGLMALATLTIGAQAADDHNAAASAKAEVPLQAILAHLPNDQELRVYQLIQATMQRNADGAWSQIKDRALTPIPPQEALVMALRKNLPIRMATQGSVQTALAVQQANAVFDPVFQLSLGNTYNMTYQRDLIGPVHYKTVLPTFGNKALPYLSADTIFGMDLSEIDYIGFSQIHKSFEQVQAYAVSSRSINPPNSQSMDLSISQQLPWGASIYLSETTSRKQTYDTNALAYKIPYDTPWGSGLSGSIMVPLPFTKNFGRLSPQDVGQKQAELAKDRSVPLLKASINSILLQTDQAYWELVKGVENLVVAIQNRQAVEALAAHTANLLEAGKTTQYGMDQMKAEVARTKVAEEAARDAMINASNSLASLVEEDPDSAGGVLLLPVGFQQALQKRATIESKEVYAKALHKRPEMASADLDVQSRTLNRDFYRHQTLPDLTMTANYGIAENNSAIGYKSISRSWTGLTDPDSHSFNAALYYNYPIGNRVAKASAEQAQDSLDDGMLAKQSTEYGVLQDVGNALAGIHGARAQEDTARRNEQLAGQALQKAQELRDAAQSVTELELLYKQRDLINARATRLAAMVNNKEAESRLLASVGTLAPTLATQTALNEFDQYRIKLLADSDAIPLFSSPPADRKPKEERGVNLFGITHGLSQIPPANPREPANSAQ